MNCNFEIIVSNNKYFSMKPIFITYINNPTIPAFRIILGSLRHSVKNIKTPIHLINQICSLPVV